MNIEPVTLNGRVVRLEPLSDRHAQDLHRASTPDLFSLMMVWEHRAELKDFEALVSDLARMGELVPFAIIHQDTNQAVGSTSYLDLRLQHRSLEIGATWISKDHQRTLVNPEAKFLMLRHAFEVLGCIRVQLKTNAQNAQSRAAMVKLGCKFEGVLRKNYLLPNGKFRDTAYYSIIDEEWESLKQAIISRLGYSP